MSDEILMPFQLATDGSIAQTSDPNVQSGQHLESLLATAPTERVMQPTYGVPIKSTVFLPDDDIAVTQLEGQIEAALATFEPNITVNAISITDSGDPYDPANITVDWSVKNIQNSNSQGVLTATILVGGQVIEGGIAQ